MPKKKYIVTLTDEEQAALEELVNKGKNPAYQVNHARILLLADTNRSGGGWKDRDINQALLISVATIERVRQRLVEQGLEAALNRKEQQNRKKRCLEAQTVKELGKGGQGLAEKELGWNRDLIRKGTREVDIGSNISIL